jgi:CBS-domain-containing membrane protein
LIGHAVGASVAFFWLSVFGLVGDPSAIATSFSAERVACVALSLACTGGLLRLLRAAHPPAGATTVIVSIGLLTTVSELAILLAGVLLLSVAAWSLNRALGVPAPAWTGSR